MNSSAEGFWKEFKELTTKLDARVAFDAIAGDFCSELVKNMPNLSHIYQYGTLSD